jgi:hypothetical protein
MSGGICRMRGRVNTLAPVPVSAHLVDLDQRPDLAPTVLALFAACPPGAEHQVCGVAAWMGLTPTQAVLDHTAGVLVAMVGNRAVAALAICPYSEEQVTIWGPAVSHGAPAAVGGELIDAARGALQLSRYGSVRTLVDSRNRKARTLQRLERQPAVRTPHRRGPSSTTHPRAPGLGQRPQHGGDSIHSGFSRQRSLLTESGEA